MGILRRLVLLPLAPIEGVIWVAEQLERQAAEQVYGPAAVQRQLEEVHAAFERGDIDEEERDEVEANLLDQITSSTWPPGGGFAVPGDGGWQ